MNDTSSSDETLPVTDVANNYFPFHDGHVYAHRAELERLKKEQEQTDTERGSEASALMGCKDDDDRYYARQRAALDRMFGR